MSGLLQSALYRFEQVARASADSDDLRRRIKLAEGKLAHVKQHAEDLSRELGASRDLACANGEGWRSAKARVDSLTKDLADARAYSVSMEVTLDMMQADLAVVTANLVNAQREIQDLAFDRTTMDRLKESVVALRAQAEEGERVRLSLRSDLEAAQGAITTLRASIEEKEQRASATSEVFHKEAEVLRTENAALKSEVKRLRMKSKAASELLAKLDAWREVSAPRQGVLAEVTPDRKGRVGHDWVQENFPHAFSIVLARLDGAPSRYVLKGFVQRAPQGWARRKDMCGRPKGSPSFWVGRTHADIDAAIRRFQALRKAKTTPKPEPEDTLTDLEARILKHVIEHGPTGVSALSRALKAPTLQVSRAAQSLLEGRMVRIDTQNGARTVLPLRPTSASDASKVLYAMNLRRAGAQCWPQKLARRANLPEGVVTRILKSLAKDNRITAHANGAYSMSAKQRTNLNLTAGE